MPMFLLRRVAGHSMEPALKEGRIVIGRRMRPQENAGQLRPGTVVILRHEGLEKIKRLTAVRMSAAGGIEVEVRGDNAEASTDSRSFGWLSASVILAVIIWPRTLHPK